MSINSICKNVLKITEDEFSEMEQIAQNQLAYIHPLKLATQARQHSLGAHNMKAVDLLRQLQTHLKSGLDQ